MTRKTAGNRSPGLAKAAITAKLRDMERLPPSTLRLGLPSGSLQSSTIDLFGRAGYRVSLQERSVFPRIDDEKLSAVLFRAQEISRYVIDGIVDCGLTGYDWIVENGNEEDVVEMCELTYSRASSNPVRWVLAVPEESPVRKPEDLAGKIIATELVNTTRQIFRGARRQRHRRILLGHHRNQGPPARRHRRI